MTWNTEKRLYGFPGHSTAANDLHHEMRLVSNKATRSITGSETRNFLYIVGWFRILDTGVMGFSSLLPDS